LYHDYIAQLTISNSLLWTEFSRSILEISFTDFKPHSNISPYGGQ